jgi:predicted transcriptional regulator
MKKHKVIVGSGSTEDFFDRSRAQAEALDRGESLPAEIRITFEDPLELLSVLSAERVRLLQRAKTGAQALAELASGLQRHARAVHRDVAILENAGLLRTRYQTNPGHGRRKVVEAVAQRYNLSADL